MDSKPFTQYSLRISISSITAAVLCYFREGRLDLARIGDQEDQVKAVPFCHCSFYLLFWAAQLLRFKGGLDIRIKEPNVF